MNSGSDINTLETFLRGIVTLDGKQASYKWWDEVKHRYPAYTWNGENVIKRTFDKAIKGTDEL